MCKLKLFLFTAMFVMLILTACQPLIIPVTPTAERTEQSATPTSTTPITATTTLSETIPAAETAVVTGTATLSDTANSATVTVSETMTTAVMTTETPTATASTDTIPVSTEPMLTVIVASLRIRSGPGTAYDVLGAAAQGEQYPIVGQADTCQWYQVTHPQLGAVWLSGGAQYASTNIACDQVAAVAAPALPTLAPTATPAPVQEQQANNPEPTPVAPTATPAPVQEQQVNNPEPTPTAPPTQPVTDPFPADQGCLLLQNQLGPELTFTFTSADGSWQDSIKVKSDQDVPYCLSPGHYRVTVDAPPPWSSLNRDFDIKAGDRAYFPIRPQ